ncbi:hypothetical protein ES332_A03G128700v1 [Gossypium tomentosum]|uniref:Pentacotripeptide-repeat region of PRORP domain-containing protein n=1 Tax=Gossypium tomentosum TaxID=34277 RepID=A0A5D2R9L9_GOSTO|nr:hypothetical protein ES332_A03G128700v1 [Gossypium tomentosum]
MPYHNTKHSLHNNIVHIKLTYSCRVCRKFRVLAHFSTSCALNTVDYFKEIDTHVSNYPELRRRINAFSTLNLMKNIDGKPTVYDCNVLMYFYLKSKNTYWQKLVEMYTGMKRFGPPPVASTFNTLLNRMLLLGDLKHAIFIVEEMYRNHFVPSFTSLSKTLKMAVKVGNLLDGLLVSEFMLRYDYHPTEPTLNKFILMLCDAGMVSDACFVFSVLLKKSYVYSVYCYNPILWALCKTGQSYTALFCREGLQDNVFQWLDFVQSNGCKPNVITYTIIVKFLFDNRKFEEAMDFLIKVMDQKGLSSDSYSYAALCGGLLKIGKVGDACELLLDIFSNGTADVVVYNIYFQCLCQENKSREALSQLKRKMKVGFKPNNVSYNTILSGFCKEKNINEDVNEPDAVTFNSILSTACRLGNSAIIQRILYHMRYEDMKLNIFKWFKW